MKTVRIMALLSMMLLTLFLATALGEDRNIYLAQDQKHSYEIQPDGTVYITGISELPEDCYTVPKTLDGYEVSGIADSAFKRMESSWAPAPEQVIIPGSVRYIGAFAFEYVPMSSLILEEGVEIIGEGAFWGTRVDEIKLPSSLKRIEKDGFYNCSRLKSVSFSEGLEFIGDTAFNGCPLEEITLPESLRSIGSQAFTCAPASVRIPSRVTELGLRAFNPRTGEVTVAEENPVLGSMDNVVYTKADMKLLFAACRDTLVIPEGIRIIAASAFQDYKCISSVQFPSTLRVIENNSFMNAGYMSAPLSLPEGLEELGDYAFADCKYLKQVTLPKSLTRIGCNPFANDGDLYTFTIPEDHPTLRMDSGFLYDYQKHRVIAFPLDIYKFETFPQGEEIIGSRVFQIHSHQLNQFFKFSLELPETVSIIEKNAFNSCWWLQSLNIPPSVEWIGEGALAGTAIQEITLPEGLPEIPDSLFYNCRSLKSVNIPESVTAIGSGAFYNCALTSLALPEGLQSVGERAFASTDLTSVTLPKGVVIIPDGLFSGCERLREAVISPETQWIGANAFRGADLSGNILVDGEEDSCCSLPDSLTYIGSGAFAESRLNTIKLPAGLERIEDETFYSCSLLQNLMLPEGLTYIGSSAFYRSGLHLNEIPDTVAYLGEYAFRYSGVTISRLPQDLTYLGNYALAGCAEGDIVIPDTVAFIGKGVFNECEALTSVEIRPQISMVPEGMFRKCSSLSSVTLPASCTQIGADAFYGCSALSDLDLNRITYFGNNAMGGTGIYNLELKDVAWLGDGAFISCRQLREITLNNVSHLGRSCFAECRNLKTAMIAGSVASIPYCAFSRCFALTDVTLPETCVSIEDSAFSDCEMLQNIVLPAAVTSIGEYAFYSCKSLAMLQLPQGLTAMGDAAFSYCKSLAMLQLPQGLTAMGDRAFSGCESLRTVTIPGTLLEIPDSAFSGCIQLVGAKLSEGVERIGSSAFSNCDQLSAVSLPESLRVIESYAFEDCENLRRIALPAGLEEIGYRVFDGCSALTEIITVPNTAADDYVKKMRGE